MKRSFYVFISLIVISLSLRAQSKEEKEIKDIVEIFNQAIIHTDSSSLKKMVVHELSYGHSNGAIQDKAAFIHAVMTGPNFFKKIERADETIKISGNNAIVRYIATAQAINNGKPVEIKYGCLMVWQKNQGIWKLVGRQGYKV